MVKSKTLNNENIKMISCREIEEYKYTLHRSNFFGCFYYYDYGLLDAFYIPFKMVSLMGGAYCLTRKNIDDEDNKYVLRAVIVRFEIGLLQTKLRAHTKYNSTHGKKNKKKAHWEH